MLPREWLMSARLERSASICEIRRRVVPSSSLKVLHANVQFLAPRRAQAATLHKSAETLLDGGAAHLPKQARNMLGIGADEVVKIDLKSRILT